MHVNLYWPFSFSKVLINIAEDKLLGNSVKVILLERLSIR